MNGDDDDDDDDDDDGEDDEFTVTWVSTYIYMIEPYRTLQKPICG